MLPRQGRPARDLPRTPLQLPGCFPAAQACSEPLPASMSAAMDSSPWSPYPGPPSSQTGHPATFPSLPGSCYGQLAAAHYSRRAPASMASPSPAASRRAEKLPR